METRPPTITRILVAIGFALSCFALALFLWITFGGPLPLKPEGYRFTVPFNEATQLAVESDVRISGVSVGKVKSIELWRTTGCADATIELDSRYAPIPADTRAMLRTEDPARRDLRGADPRGRAAARPCRRAARCRRRRSPRRSSSTRSSAPSTPARATPSRSGCRGRPPRSSGRGPDLSAAIAELDPFAEETNRLLRILDSQQPAVRQLVHNGGDVFQALSERQGQLRGLIQNSNTVFSTTARRNRDLEQLFRILPTFQRESRATLERLNTLRRQHRPAGPAAPARPRSELSPTLVAAGKAAPDLQAFFEGLRGAIRRLGHGLPGAPQAARRRLHAAPLPARRHRRRPGSLPRAPELDHPGARDVQARDHRLPRQRRRGDAIQPARG